MKRPPKVDRTGPFRRCPIESLEPLREIGNVLIWTAIGLAVVAAFLAAMST